MPVSRLASESDILGTDILTTAAVTLIRTTGITDRTTMGTMVGRHFIGITDTECTTRAIVTTATGGKINGEEFSQASGCKIPSALIFSERLKQLEPTSMQPTATIPEIPSLSVPEEPAILAGASFQFPVAEHVQSGAAPGDSVVQIGRAFRLQDATQNHAQRRRLHARLAADIFSRARALFSVLPGPFASTARHSSEISVDPPEASQSSDRENC